MNNESFRPTIEEEEPLRMEAEVYASLVHEYDTLTRTILDTSHLRYHRPSAREGEQVDESTVRADHDAREKHLTEKYTILHTHLDTARTVCAQLIAEQNARLVEATQHLECGEETYWPDDTPSVKKQSVGLNGDEVVMYGRKGAQISLTKGDLAIGPLWGRDYRFAPTIPREHVETYLTARHKEEMCALKDRLHMLTFLCDSLNENSPTCRAYEALLQRGLGKAEDVSVHAPALNEREERARERSEAGVIAEAMVKSFLTKITIDHPALGITLVPASPEQDVERKVDFLLRIKNYTQNTQDIHHVRATGTQVHEEDATQVGVQFTISENLERLAHKRQQITRQATMDRLLMGSETRDNTPEHNIAGGDVEHIDSYVLVALSPGDVTGQYNAWKTSPQKTPGGPEQLWTQDEQEKMFRGVLSELPEGLVNIDEAWARVCATS